MLAALWIVMAVILGGAAALLLYAGLQLTSREAPADSTWTPLDRSDAPGQTRVVTTS